MNKQIITKVAVLIDKLSYISNNNDFNNLNKDNVDFNLLKSYSKELYELLNSITTSEKKAIVENTASYKKNEPPIAITKPVAVTKPIETRQEAEVVNEISDSKPEEELNMKPISANIFDTVNSIKTKSKISRLNRLQLTENEVANEQQGKSIEEVIEKTEPIIDEKEMATENNEVAKATEIKPSFIKEITEEKTEEAKEAEENLSLNDRFKQPTESVADKVANSNYKNLKELIDINDRFLFIQKLFGGSYLAFEESVNQINSIDTYSEALDYIDHKIKSNFDWDSNADEVAKFLSILEKKYN